MNKAMKDFCKKKQKDPSYYSSITVHDLTTPVTVLLGPNGTGKSMSLRLMKEYCKENNFKYASYSTSRDDIVQKSSPAFGNWDIYGLSCAFHSEGERMCDSFSDWASKEFLKVLLEDKFCPVWIFIDEADSGLSIDRIIKTIKPIINIAKLDSKHRKLHIVFTCNSYELAQVLNSDATRFIWIPTREEVTLDSYEQFTSMYIEYADEMFTEED